jgi:hypothetical protein
MTIDQILENIKGAKWTSLGTEVRPSIVKAEDGIKPLYCTREFEFPKDDVFILKFKNYADPGGKVPLVEMLIAGHIFFGEKHPAAAGAFEIDYLADLSFVITVLNEQFASVLNQFTDQELGSWSVNKPKEVLGKSVPAFGLQSNKLFKEYDLIYLEGDMLFNGARHIDGRPFDTPENRPTNLQIPLKKVKF